MRTADLRTGLAWLASPAPHPPTRYAHTFATRLLAKTHDVALVQKALRHASITSTMVYAAMDDRRVREAIEA